MSLNENYNWTINEKYTRKSGHPVQSYGVTNMKKYKIQKKLKPPSFWSSLKTKLKRYVVNLGFDIRRKHPYKVTNDYKKLKEKSYISNDSLLLLFHMYSHDVNAFTDLISLGQTPRHRTNIQVKYTSKQTEIFVQYGHKLIFCFEKRSFVILFIKTFAFQFIACYLFTN